MSLEVPGTDSGLSNPFSTGGGGVTFEHLVGASYLVSLLAHDVPRGLDRGITERVAFQRRWSGAVLDDVVVTSRTWDGQERHLALAVKHDLTFSSAESNTLFYQVISDCWQTFAGAIDWPFDPDRDRIGIAIGEYPAVLDRHLQRVLDWARTAESTAEFSKIEIERFSSAEMRNYVQVFRTVLADSARREISDDELWRVNADHLVKKQANTPSPVATTSRYRRSLLHPTSWHVKTTRVTVRCRLPNRVHSKKLLQWTRRVYMRML